MERIHGRSVQRSWKVYNSFIFDIYLHSMSQHLHNIRQCVCMLSCFSHVWLFATLQTVACQAPLSIGLSWQEYWNGLPVPSPGYLPDPDIKPVVLALAGRFFTAEPPRKPNIMQVSVWIGVWFHYLTLVTFQRFFFPLWNPFYFFHLFLLVGG